MKGYERKDERQRTIGDYVWIKEDSGPVEVTHTFSSAYYNAIMSDDLVFMEKLIKGESDLEYLVDQE